MDASVKQQSRWNSSEERRVSRNQSSYITITKEGENILVIHFKVIEQCWRNKDPGLPHRCPDYRRPLTHGILAMAVAAHQ